MIIYNNMSKRCITTNSIIEDLHKGLQEETLESVKGLVELWQDRNNKDWDSYPTLEELKDFRAELRKDDSASSVLDEILSSSVETPKIISLEERAKVNLDFTPMMKRDRVSLITRFFSDEIDLALQEHNDAINKSISKAEEEGNIVAVNELREQLNSLDRLGIIREYTPAGIFSRVKGIFENYVLDSEENRIQGELSKINNTPGSEEYSSEEKLEAAKKRASYKFQEYNKVIDNFDALAEEASSMFATTEGIKVDINYAAPKDANLSDIDENGDSVAEELSDGYSKEETVKEGWMTHYREVSPQESLSQEVRKAIREIPKLDYDMFYEEDDLGFPRYLDADYVHATLVNKLSNMVTSDDMIPLLEDLSRTKPWIGELIEVIEADQRLFSKFYQDFRLDFTPYWIQKSKLNANGSLSVKTISVNKPEGIRYLLNDWRDNYEWGNQLDSDSIYNKDRTINFENAEKGLKWTKALGNKFNNLTTEGKLELLEDESVWKTINKLLNMVGIGPNPAILKSALTNVKTYGTQSTSPINDLIRDLDIIFSGVKKEDADSDKDLFNSFESAYKSIALMLSEVTEDAVESSTRENGKTRYSYTKPNYLGKLVKQLKNAWGDEQKYKEYIYNDFGKYDWFYKDGRWRNDWLRQIVENPDIRKGFGSKVVLNFDKVDYENWDKLDYSIVLLTEYFADPNSKSDIQWANYHVPILSDAASAEFIRFRKYTNKSIIGDDGKYRSYDDILLDKMVDLVNQEVDRIAFVIQRDKQYRAGDTSTGPVANFDITRNEDGTIKSIGGAEFKFIPALNNLRYEGGVTFLQEVKRLQQEGSGEELEALIKDAVRDIIDNSFEEAYREWHRAGLFRETSSGNYQYLTMLGLSKGQSFYNAKVAKALVEARDVLANLWTPNMEYLLGLYNNNAPIDDTRANRDFNAIRSLLEGKVQDGTITAGEFDAINNNLVVKNPAKEKLREYFWNSEFATSQIIQLTTTDLAFYDGVIDFQKRFKEIHSPSSRLNTNSEYGRKVERTIYLKDNIIESSVLKDIDEILNERVKNGEMSKRDRDLILNKFREVNTGDAQAYRSLSSYRAILDMMGQWTDDMQRAYENLQEGKWSADDFNIIWQTKKPFLYTQVESIGGVEGYSNFKTPVQHKNSEFLLLAMYESIASSTGHSEKLRAINEFMEERGIDVIQFESAVKVGKQGVVDLNGVDDYKSVKEVLNNATVQNGVENPNVVHKVSYEDYGIQTETPEHSIDATALFGTQTRKLITADISYDAQIEVDGKVLSKNEWMEKYDSIISQNVHESYQEVHDLFSSPESVSRIIQDELRGNPRYSSDILTAFDLNSEGEFNIPPFDPIQSQTTQSLLYSIIRDRITKQKIKGGALIQVSSFGLSNDLEIVFEGEGSNKRIKYLECYMPAYSRKFYEPLMKAGSGELDINQLPDDLRRLIGYRIPTEDKYSMAPLYIKGFLPQQNGSAIMLPAEITTIAGSDFDVDKLFIMLPEFDTIYRDVYNKKQFTIDLISQLSKGAALSPEELSEYRKTISDAIRNGKNSPEGSTEYNIWRTYEENKKNYYTGKKAAFRRVKYDWSKTPAENSLRARNNALIDLIWGVLTNSDTASKILNPGGFDYQKKAARIITILQSGREEDLKRELNIPADKNIYEVLNNMDLKTQLDPLAKRFNRALDPLNPMTQLILHQQNMTGAALIGIYANHNANHALMQHTQVGLDEENGGFSINGKQYTSLHGVMNDNKEYISRNNAGFLAASVDNAKDPVLAALNQNEFSANASMLLSRLGYNPIEIGLTMNQPIVVAMSDAFARESREGKWKDTIIREVINRYRKYAGIETDVTYDNYKSNKFMNSELADNIMKDRALRRLSDDSKIEFYKGQVAVGTLLERIMKSSDALSQLVMVSKADTSNGASGTTIADTQIRIQRMEDFIASTESSKFPLVEADVIKILNVEGKSREVLMSNIMNTPLPYVQAFYTLGVQETQNMLGKYFPQFNESFKRVIDGYNSEGDSFRGLRQYTKSGMLNSKTMNNVYNDLFAYIMSKTEFFGSSLDGEDNIIPSSYRRKFFINKFPEYFTDVVANNPKIADLEFIKRLRVIRANKDNPVDTVVFRNVGQLSPALKEKYTRDWASLLYMGPEAQQLALNLFRYSYYRNGFAFGPNTFIHLAPVVIRQVIPEYVSTLRGLTTTEDDYRQFIEQYIYNHLDNKSLVPEVTKYSSISFTGSNGKPLETLNITIDSNSSLADQKIVRNVMNTVGEPVYDFFDFISRQEKGVMLYYRLNPSETTTNMAVYDRIRPLGFKNSFIEYEYGKNASEMESVITKNTTDYDSTSLDDVIALENMGFITEDYAGEIPYDGSLERDVSSEAYEIVYGAPLDIDVESVNDILSIQPNLDYRDANDEIICGAPSIGSL